MTVSWTKFHYTARTDNTGNDSTGAAGHRYSNLVGGSDNSAADVGKLNVTWHHNWWADRVVERQPRVRYGKNHLFNNLWSSSGDNYCVRAGMNAQILLESNVFVGVKTPHEFNNTADQGTSFITSTNNVYSGTSGTLATGGGGTAVHDARPTRTRPTPPPASRPRFRPAPGRTDPPFLRHQADEGVSSRSEMKRRHGRRDTTPRLLALVVLSFLARGGEAFGAPLPPAESPACLSDPGYARAYAELRARWVRFGGISSGSIPSDARVRIETAAVLVRRAPALAVHARLQRESIARLRAWTAAQIDAESGLAFYLRQLMSQTETDAGRVEWLARAVTDEATKARIAGGTRVVDALLHAHPELTNAPSNSVLETRWGAVSWEERRPLIEAGEDIARRLSFEGRPVFDGLALEYETNGPHRAFLPRMTWFGAGLPEAPCPVAVDGLLRALTSLGLDGNYDAMMSGRTLPELARFSHLVREIKTEFHELGCLRPLPPARVRHRAEARRIEIDAYSRPASCGQHLVGRHFSRRGEAYENAVPPVEQLRRVADQIVGAP